MKNLEIEADKANAHLEKTLLPKESIEGAESESTEGKEEGISKDEESNARAADTSEPPSDSPAEIEEAKKDK